MSYYLVYICKYIMFVYAARLNSAIFISLQINLSKLNVYHYLSQNVYLWFFFFTCLENIIYFLLEGVINLRSRYCFWWRLPVFYFMKRLCEPNLVDTKIPSQWVEFIYAVKTWLKREVVVNGRDLIMSIHALRRLCRTARFFTCWSGICLISFNQERKLEKRIQTGSSKLQMEKLITSYQMKIKYTVS